MMLRDCRYLISGTPDRKTADMLYDLYQNQTRVAIWSHRDGRAFMLTSLQPTLLPGQDIPRFDLIFQQVGPLDMTERLFDDHASWVTNSQSVES